MPLLATDRQGSGRNPLPSGGDGRPPSAERDRLPPLPGSSRSRGSLGGDGALGGAAAAGPLRPSAAAAAAALALRQQQQRAPLGPLPQIRGVGGQSHRLPAPPAQQHSSGRPLPPAGAPSHPQFSQQQQQQQQRPEPRPPARPGRLSFVPIREDCGDEESPSTRAAADQAALSRVLAAAGGAPDRQAHAAALMARTGVAMHEAFQAILLVDGDWARSEALCRVVATAGAGAAALGVREAHGLLQRTGWDAAAAIAAAAAGAQAQGGAARRPATASAASAGPRQVSGASSSRPEPPAAGPARPSSASASPRVPPPTQQQQQPDSTEASPDSAGSGGTVWSIWTGARAMARRAIRAAAPSLGIEAAAGPAEPSESGADRAPVVAPDLSARRDSPAASAAAPAAVGSASDAEDDGAQLVGSSAARPASGDSDDEFDWSTVPSSSSAAEPLTAPSNNVAPRAPAAAAAAAPAAVPQQRVPTPPLQPQPPPARSSSHRLESSSGAAAAAAAAQHETPPSSSLPSHTPPQRPATPVAPPAAAAPAQAAAQAAAEPQAQRPSSGAGAASGSGSGSSAAPAAEAGPSRRLAGTAGPPVTPALCRVGLAVVRGPGWRWGDQDGGAGSVGDVCDVSNLEVGWAAVTWRRLNKKCTYRVTLEATDLAVCAEEAPPAALAAAAAPSQRAQPPRPTPTAAAAAATAAARDSALQRQEEEMEAADSASAGAEELAPGDIVALSADSERHGAPTRGLLSRGARGCVASTDPTDPSIVSVCFRAPPGASQHPRPSQQQQQRPGFMQWWYPRAALVPSGAPRFSPWASGGGRVGVIPVDMAQAAAHPAHAGGLRVRVLLAAAADGRQQAADDIAVLSVGFVSATTVGAAMRAASAGVGFGDGSVGLAQFVGRGLSPEESALCVVSGGLALSQTARALAPGDAVAFEAVATRGGLGMRFSMVVNGNLVESSDLGPGSQWVCLTLPTGWTATALISPAHGRAAAEAEARQTQAAAAEEEELRAAGRALAGGQQPQAPAAAASSSSRPPADSEASGASAAAGPRGASAGSGAGSVAAAAASAADVAITAASDASRRVIDFFLGRGNDGESFRGLDGPGALDASAGSPAGGGGGVGGGGGGFSTVTFSEQDYAGAADGAGGGGGGSAASSSTAGAIRLDFPARCEALRAAITASAAAYSGSALGLGVLAQLVPTLTTDIQVRRSPPEALIEDSLRQLGSPLDPRSADKWRRPLMVTFVGENGLDRGGLTREWFSLVASAVASLDVVRPTANEGAQELYLNPTGARSPDDVRLCQFVGGVMGKAILESADRAAVERHGTIALGALRFCDVLYKVLLSQTIGFSDLECIDPYEFRSLRAIMETDADVQDILPGQCFVYEDNSVSPPREVNLVPHGHRIPVTNANRAEYCELKARFLLSKAPEELLDAVCDGFFAVVDIETLRRAQFTPRELRLLVCGRTRVNLADLRPLTRYTGEFSSSHPVIGWLWEVLLSLTGEQALLFLKFYSGADAVPAAGFRALRDPPLLVQSMGRGGGAVASLPMAHTCFCQLDLPMYASREELRTQLLKAMELGQGVFAIS